MARPLNPAAGNAHRWAASTVMVQGNHMKRLPQTQNPIVLRTDFTSQSAWEKVRDAIQKPIGDFRACVEFVEDMEYQDVNKEQLFQYVPDDYAHSFIIIFDHLTVSLPESPLLIVDLYHKPGREFRAVPSQIFEIASNLAIANISFSEFADFVDEDGIYSGFPIKAEDICSPMHDASVESVLASVPIWKPPKPHGIQQLLRYWISAVILHFWRKRD